MSTIIAAMGGRSDAIHPLTKDDVIFMLIGFCITLMIFAFIIIWRDQNK